MRDSYDYVIVGAGDAGCVLANRLSAEHDVLLLDADGIRLTDVLGSADPVVYLRGDPTRYDSWPGGPGWGQADLLPYFRRAEDNVHGSSHWHGVGGPLRIEDVHHPDRLSSAFVRAAADWGLPESPDLNAGRQVGTGLHQVLAGGATVIDAYLRPVLTRPGLTVRAGTRARQLLLDGGRVTGVQLDAGRQVHAEGQVLLCAGAVESALLLRRSGIGPADQLREQGIAVLADLPVQQHLQRQVSVPMVWRTHGRRPSVPLLDTLARRTGTARSGGAQASGFWSSTGSPSPDVQLRVAPPSAAGDLTIEVIATAGAGPAGTATSDPSTLTQADVDVLVAGCRVARDIAAQPSLARTLLTETAPGADTVRGEELAAYVRRNARQHGASTSTCPIGPVLDADLQVLGLRVVGPAALPSVPGGSVWVTSVAVAERAADLITGRTPDSVGAPGARHRPA